MNSSQTPTNQITPLELPERDLSKDISDALASLSASNTPNTSNTSNTQPGGPAIRESSGLPSYGATDIDSLSSLSSLSSISSAQENYIVPETPTIQLDVQYNEAIQEVIQQAKGFQNLNLLSGNQIPSKYGMTLEAYIQKNYGKLGLIRLNLAKNAMRTLGYRTSPDVLLMLACTKRARAIVATAGAGKTTSLQLEIVVDKQLDKGLKTNELKPEVVEGTTVEMPRILYLNYNRHNVDPIVRKHISVCNAINKRMSDESAIDSSIESSTVHAFCHKWLNAFSSDIKLPTLEIISDENKKKIWEAIIAPRWKKYYDLDSDPVSYEVLDELYTYKTESMLEWNEFFDTAKFVDADLHPKFAKACIQKYDAMKRQMEVMDFTDYLILTIDTLRNNPELKRKLQERYRLIIADENQDFTRLMNELLLELYNPKINRLVVVGDPDQTLYEFKGVSPDNVVHLVNRLQDCQVLGLDTNYRCPDGIVEPAKNILALNHLRFEKPINTVRTGGLICKHPLEHDEEQPKQVIELLTSLGVQALPRTVIAYRNNTSAMIICEELYYAGIPFQCLDGTRPFNYTVFKHLNNCLRALKAKDNFELNKALFRFMPFTREQWERVLEEHRQKRISNLFDIQIDPAYAPRFAKEALDKLKRIAAIVETNAVSDYIETLVKLYRFYHFDYMARADNPFAPENSYTQLYLDRAIKFFNRQLTWDYMQQELKDKATDSSVGVSISTFHGLKGLEFDYVIAIDFAETVFPNYRSIEEKYKPNTAVREKEAENRLCYVLVTRTIKELHLFYPRTDPSIYVKILTQAGAVTRPGNEFRLSSNSSNLSSDSSDSSNSSNKSSKSSGSTSTSTPAPKEKKLEEEIELGTVSSGSIPIFSRQAFINRLTQGRKGG